MFMVNLWCRKLSVNIFFLTLSLYWIINWQVQTSSASRHKSLLRHHCSATKLYIYSIYSISISMRIVSKQKKSILFSAFYLSFSSFYTTVRSSSQGVVFMWRLNETQHPRNNDESTNVLWKLIKYVRQLANKLKTIIAIK